MSIVRSVFLYLKTKSILRTSLTISILRPSLSIFILRPLLTISILRTSLPELLHKRDRGRPTEAVVEMANKKFGEKEVYQHVPGAEVLDATSEVSL